MAENVDQIKIIVRSVDGREISSLFKEVNPGLNTWTLNTKKWPAGMLLLTITGNRLDWKRKIVHY
jgi:hypothetical protein